METEERGGADAAAEAELFRWLSRNVPEWFERGRTEGAAYLLVLQDTWDLADEDAGFFPCYAADDAELDRIYRELEPENTLLHEILDLRFPWPAQRANPCCRTPEAVRAFAARYVADREARGGVPMAAILAIACHLGRTDKGGRPYLLHPLRVMSRLETEAEWCAALLHDVVEDGPVTLEDLRERGFSPEVVAAVDGLTRRKGEAYEAYVERAGGIPIARRVKLADLADNLDVTRLPELGEEELERLARYHRAWRALSAPRS